jgi:hypothetical protein
MTIVANTFLTFAAKGIREQLSDVIYNVSPEDTPVVSMMAKTRAKGVLNEWQTDVLGAPDASNAQLEGDDISSFPAIVPTVRVGNYQQISRKLLAISGTEEEVEKAGRKSELNYQTALRGAELKRDIETIVLTPQGGVAGNSTTARKTATLGAFVKTNTDCATDGVDPSYTGGVPSAARTDGTQRAFTETILKSVLQKIWTVSGDKPKFGFAGPHNKQVFSGFSGIATKTYYLNKPQASPVVATADVYVGEFSVIEVLPDRFQRDRDFWVLNPDFLEMQHLRPFRREELAKTGDATKVMLLVEWGIKVRQEAALGLAADLTTS